MKMKRYRNRIWTLMLLFVVCVSLCSACFSSSTDTNSHDGAQNNANDPNNADQNNAGENEEPDLIDERDETIRRELEQMTLKQKVGQLFIVGLEGTTVSDADLARLQQDEVSGFILFNRNIESPEQTFDLIDDLKVHNAGPPLIFSVDEEGGSVSRLPEPLHTLPSAREIAAQVTTETAEELAEASGHILQSLGFNMNFAPVLDVDSNPQNPVIGSRAYGSTPEQVIQYGERVMSGLKQASIIPVVKHFPGHGDTELDSHIGLPIIEHPMERLEKIEFAPFKQMVESNEADVIMVGHLVISALDPDKPATLSHELINGLLREKWGYDGVVVTDDMTMGAIAEPYGMGEAAKLAIEAGVDLLLIAHDEQLQSEAIASVIAAVQSGKISEERIDESVVRILRLKNKYELSDDKAPFDQLQKHDQHLENLMKQAF